MSKKKFLVEDQVPETSFDPERTISDDAPKPKKSGGYYEYARRQSDMWDKHIANLATRKFSKDDAYEHEILLKSYEEAVTSHAVAMQAAQEVGDQALVSWHFKKMDEYGDKNQELDKNISWKQVDHSGDAGGEVDTTDLRKQFKEKNKHLGLSELRKIIRSVLIEVMNEEENDAERAKTEPAPPSHAAAVAKTQPAPAAAQNNRTTVGARDLNKVMQRMDVPTIPAKASNAERAMNQEFKAKNRDKTGTAKQIPTTYSPHAQKASMISKVLSSKGVNADEEALKAWLGGMDPSDVLVKTTEQLASEYLGQQNAASA